jgi:glyoxylase-like metal-dependent hydrolase (beta-lactamase superfamily II)
MTLFFKARVTKRFPTNMTQTPIHPLDLNFRNRQGAIAAYLIRHSGGAVMVESGPGSTIEALKADLAALGLTPRDVTHVLLTHIHLDHAGAAGWLSQQGAQVYVHPVGAPHMLDPQKLLASALRLYGDKMDFLWGQFLPVPPKKLTEVQDGQEIAIGSLRFTGIHTPGHARHHVAYLFEDTCFTGDIGGVRIPGPSYLRLPMVPPETHIEDWRASLLRLRQIGFRHVAPTHFGIYDDAAAHLTLGLRTIDEAERWLEREMPADPPIETLREHFVEWLQAQGRVAGISEDNLAMYEIANPTWMGADGLQRYWRKFRLEA